MAASSSASSFGQRFIQIKALEDLFRRQLLCREVVKPFVGLILIKPLDCEKLSHKFQQSLDRMQHIVDPQLRVPTPKSFNDPRDHRQIFQQLSIPDDLLSCIVVAGGAVLDCIFGNTPNDYDLFIFGDVDPYQVTEKLLSIWANRITFAMRTEHSITVKIGKEHPNTISRASRWNPPPRDLVIQIVLRHYRTPNEVVYGFDLEPCRCLIYRDEMWMTPSCKFSIKTATMTVDLSRASTTYNKRLSKYHHKRSFAVYIPIKVKAMHLELGLRGHGAEGSLVGLLSYLLHKRKTYSPMESDYAFVTSQNIKAGRANIGCRGFTVYLSNEKFVDPNQQDMMSIDSDDDSQDLPKSESMAPPKRKEKIASDSDSTDDLFDGIGEDITPPRAASSVSEAEKLVTNQNSRDDFFYALEALTINDNDTEADTETGYERTDVPEFECDRKIIGYSFKKTVDVRHVLELPDEVLPTLAIPRRAVFMTENPGRQYTSSFHPMQLTWEQWVKW